MDPQLHAEITATCRHVAAMMGMAGYCRFDLRQGPDGSIQIIDINANPDIGPGSGFRKALAAANIRFEDAEGPCPASAAMGDPWQAAASTVLAKKAGVTGTFKAWLEPPMSLGIARCESSAHSPRLPVALLALMERRRRACLIEPPRTCRVRVISRARAAALCWP